MADPVVSVLLPTRGRPQLLRKSVFTLLDRATWPDEVQICYGIDVDDKDTAAALYHPILRLHDIVWAAPESYGYGGFHIYANELAVRATGDWLLLWNDDAIMRTIGWDEVIKSYELTKILSPRCNHAEGIVAFPIVPRIFVETLGHFSLNPHNDTWWQYLADGINRLKWVDIDILHDRFDMTGNNNDETYQRTRTQMVVDRTADRFWNDDMPLMEKDKVVLLDLLQQLGDRCAGTCDG